ncbi:enoyl-CoA hydratase [Variovorax paradoxus]|uniref:enoyl-CoA hydratase n=1 Tax=Variovorax paradoxus TaxID=34073 RepID=UPI0007805CB8|nr:enoyl-CoA hydratase [Variovorax paradoxus]
MARYPLQGDSLRVEVAEGIATITLNRPSQHNALSRELRANLLTALRALQDDDEVGVVILTGAGDKSFSVGADLKEMQVAQLGADELGPAAPMMQAFAALTKPTIAAINGFAITGGFELAIHCDILVASTRAQFADTHARVGLVSAWGLSQYLRELIGPVRARYLSFTGNYLDAATAKAWGLVLDVVPPEELMPFCHRIAQDILECDSATVRDLKRAIDGGLHGTLDEGLALEGELARACLSRFDAGGFGERRAMVMRRGQRQAT